MILRALVRTAILTAVVAGPVMYFKAPEMWAKTRDAVASAVAPTAPVAETQPTASKSPPVAAIKSAEPEVEGPPVQDLAEVLRFDVSTGWVMGRWARVSTGMSQLKLQGYRVALNAVNRFYC